MGTSTSASALNLSECKVSFQIFDDVIMWYFSAKEELEEAKAKVSVSVVQLESKLSEVNQQMDVENKRWQRVLDLEAKSWKELSGTKAKSKGVLTTNNDLNVV